MGLILHRLFLKTVVLISILLIILCGVLNFIFNKLNSYQYYLNSKLSRTYHIILNDKEAIKYIKKYIRGYSFFSTAEKEITIKRGMYIYKGKVTLVGIFNKHFPAGFQYEYIDSRLYTFNLYLTPIEIVDTFNNNGMVFNRTLYNLLGRIASPNSEEYRLSDIILTSYGIYDDLIDKPIIYLGINSFKQIVRKINQIYIGVLLKNIKDIDEVLDILRAYNFKAYPYYYKDKYKIEFIKKLKSEFCKIKILIIILIMIAVILSFINVWILKQKQLKILKTLGIDIEKIFELVFILVFLSGIICIAYVYFFDCKGLN